MCLSSDSVLPGQQQKLDSMFLTAYFMRKNVLNSITCWTVKSVLMKYAVRFCCCPGRTNVCSSQTFTLLLFSTFQLAWFVQMFSSSYLQRQYDYIIELWIRFIFRVLLFHEMSVYSKDRKSSTICWFEHHEFVFFHDLWQ